jgi:glycosyltransferase involved in cell wall biosynthesis
LSDLPKVSIVIPCRNEEKFIGKCLDSIVANDYPKDRLEILVVDGMSEDGTRTTVQNYTRDYTFIRLLDNPKKITPAALNIGITSATGDIIMRMDAHSMYPPGYISGLIGWLERTHADNVGGVCIAVPAVQTVMAEAIALALSHPFGVGNAYFRIGVKEPRWVDTVPFGCYRREVFDRIGLFDEELVRNQDDEFNLRLLKRGGRILVVPSIVSYYHARDSLRKLWRMYYQYGYFKPLVARKVGGVLTLRQVIPVAFLLGLLVSGVIAPWSVYGRGLFGVIIIAYCLANLGCSIVISFRRRLGCVLSLAVVFPVLHLSYGVGYMMGIIDHVIVERKRRKNVAEIPLTR